MYEKITFVFYIRIEVVQVKNYLNLTNFFVNILKSCVAVEMSFFKSTITTLIVLFVN